jgi:hypothetical protein
VNRPSVALLAVAAGLFAAWIGYLAFLALTTRHPPIVLSRPQFLVADLWVIAEVDDLNGPVKVVEVAYARREVLAKAPKPGAVIEVKNLAECKKDWTQPGAYILPLVAADKLYQVPPIPRSPGYNSGPPRIYPDTPETREQLDSLPRP